MESTEKTETSASWATVFKIAFSIILIHAVFHLMPLVMVTWSVVWLLIWFTAIIFETDHTFVNSPLTKWLNVLSLYMLFLFGITAIGYVIIANGMF